MAEEPQVATMLSNQLLNLFLQSYYEAGHRPRAILMANTGVKILQPESQFAKVLKDFKDAGCGRDRPGG